MPYIYTQSTHSGYLRPTALSHVGDILKWSFNNLYLRSEASISDLTFLSCSCENPRPSFSTLVVNNSSFVSSIFIKHLPSILAASMASVLTWNFDDICVSSSLTSFVSPSGNYAGILYRSISRLRMCLYVTMTFKDIWMSKISYQISLRRIIFNRTYICCISIKRHIMLYNIYS